MEQEYTIGRIGERLAFKEFLNKGFEVKNNIYKEYSHDFDFLVNNKKTEVKTSNLNYKGKWIVSLIKNLDRELKNKFDILFFIGIYRRKYFYFIIPQEDILSIKGIGITPFSNTKNWRYYEKYLNNWKVFDC